MSGAPQAYPDQKMPLRAISNLSGTEDDGVYVIAGLLRDGDDGKEPDIDRISNIANSWIFLD